MQGAVESFDLAVLPGAVRFDEDLVDVQFSAERAQRVAICPGVVGHDLLDDRDAVAGEVLGGSPQKRRAGRPLLVGQDFAVGQPGVTADDGVHVVET